MNSKDEIQNPVSGNSLDGAEGSAVKGVIYGALIDILGSLLLGVLYGFGYAAILVKQDVPADEIIARLQAMDHWSLSAILFSALGVLISFYAGYICAKKSIVNIARNATILCVISCGFGLYLGYEIYSFWENIFFAILTSVAVFFGAFFWKKKILHK